MRTTKEIVGKKPNIESRRAGYGRFFFHCSMHVTWIRINAPPSTAKKKFSARTSYPSFARRVFHTIWLALLQYRQTRLIKILKNVVKNQDPRLQYLSHNNITKPEEEKNAEIQLITANSFSPNSFIYLFLFSEYRSNVPVDETEIYCCVRMLAPPNNIISVTHSQSH